MTRIVPLLSILLVACLPLEPEVHIPTLDEVSSEADSAVGLVDRSAALADAAEGEDGEPLDLTAQPAGFYLDIDSAELQGTDVPARIDTYRNVGMGVWAAAWADAVTVAVVGPPAAAIGIAAQGTIEEVEPFAWTATNTVTSPEGDNSITGQFTVAWVRTGWLAEMRLTSTDGKYDDTRWFNGYVENGGGQGWWDLWLEDELVGVIEYVADEPGSGTGVGEYGIASLYGETASDVLAYEHRDDAWMISYWDDSEAFQHHVHLAADQSGDVLVSSYNGGELACWDTNYADVDCP